MAREIERRWLLDPNLVHGLHTRNVKRIVQKYMIIDDKNLFERRIRRQEKDGQVTYERTDKIGEGEGREEFSEPATEQGFEFPGDIIGNPIVKDVYLHTIPNGLTMEVHVFDGPLFGHVSIEIEFLTSADARVYVAPPWFGREVTEDRRYNGCNLCRYGVPKEER